MTENKIELKIRKSVTYLIFVVLLFILICLLYIVTLVIQHYEAFDENPLLFGAQQYGLDSCICFADDKTLHFTQQKIWQEKKLINSPTIEVNLTGVNNLLTG